MDIPERLEISKDTAKTVFSTVRLIARLTQWRDYSKYEAPNAPEWRVLAAFSEISNHFRILMLFAVGRRTDNQLLLT